MEKVFLKKLSEITTIDDYTGKTKKHDAIIIANNLFINENDNGKYYTDTEQKDSKFERKVFCIRLYYHSQTILFEPESILKLADQIKIINATKKGDQ